MSTNDISGPVRIGVIGAGYVAEAAHLPYLTRSPIAEVCVLADLDLGRAQRLAKRFKITRVASDYEEIINDDTIDVIDVCTPASTHALIATEAMRRGKGVIVEKPLARTLDEAKEIAEALRESGARLCAVLNLRYMPAVWKALQLVNDGSLGQLHHVSAFSHTREPAAHSLQSHRAEFDIFYDYVPHIVDFVMWATSSVPRRVLCTRIRQHLIDAYTLLVDMELPDGNACVMSLDASWHAATTQRQVRFFGTELDLTVDLRNQAVYTTRGYSTPIQDAIVLSCNAFGLARRALGGIASLRYGAMAYHRDLLGDFLRRFVTGERPRVSFVDALMHVVVVDAAVRSVREGVPIEVKWYDLLKEL